MSKEVVGFQCNNSSTDVNFGNSSFAFFCVLQPRTRDRTSVRTKTLRTVPWYVHPPAEFSPILMEYLLVSSSPRQRLYVNKHSWSYLFESRSCVSPSTTKTGNWNMNVNELLNSIKTLILGTWFEASTNVVLQPQWCFVFATFNINQAVQTNWHRSCLYTVAPSSNHNEMFQNDSSEPWNIDSS